MLLKCYSIYFQFIMSSENKSEYAFTNASNPESWDDYRTALIDSTLSTKCSTITTAQDIDTKDISDDQTLKTARTAHIEETTYTFENESAISVFCQTFLPFLVAGLGSISTGLLMYRIQRTDLVCKVPEFIAICPPLQAMKGNLDMTFTSRLGTMAHQGRLRKHPGRIKRILRNYALLQV
ncbi:hypothetical protein DICVIV_04450 [Dictyocaulus viviparus]|uniref:SLC41A/MgtE integral membrane domain-containing protein n=1 Tax=Dictyocaulus viviparus TaxID=29172 RepID=A0A0D8XXQ2_DICVI|nr:hypothetical protein DICVIV_04450 [Dictyocaulus viviparus]